MTENELLKTLEIFKDYEAIKTYKENIARIEEESRSLEAELKKTGKEIMKKTQPKIEAIIKNL